MRQKANAGDDLEPKLWIIKWQAFLSKPLHSDLLASMFMFYLPIMITGCLFQAQYQYRIFSNGVLLALLWIAIAPLLIHDALKSISSFFTEHKHVFRNPEEWSTLHAHEIERFQSSRYMLFGLPWAIATSVAVLYSIFRTAPLPIQVWAAVSFFLLFFLSSIGFYGVYVLITLFQNVCAADVLFDPFHPDKFGGISDFGRFAVRGTLYFSSGALVFPLAFEAIAAVSNGSDPLLMGIYFLVGFFIFALFACFLIPVFQIKKLVDPEKDRIIVASWAELNRMIAAFREKDTLDLKQGADILLYYYFHHMKLLEIKDYPWDFRVLLEFGLSFAVPIGVAILQIILG